MIHKAGGFAGKRCTFGDMSITVFASAFREAIENTQLIKLHLSAYRGPEMDLKAIIARVILLKNVPAVQFTYRYKTRDIIRNAGTGEAPALVSSWLQAGHFEQAQLFSQKKHLHLELRNLNEPKLHQKKVTGTELPDLEHDRRKQRVLNAATSTWLENLGLAGPDGVIFKNAQDKYRQIQHFATLLEPEISAQNGLGSITAFDMGSGKGYLTFAVYELLKKHYRKVSMTGVEMRGELAAFCNEQATGAGLEGLKFVEGSIDSHLPAACDLLMALHACDTATDDALWAGIQAGARWIVAAPCCHKEVRREMEGKNHGKLAPVSRFGIFLEREAEMVTDAIRTLILEYFGYRVKVLEFVSDAHTPKNVLLLATKENVSEAARAETLTNLRDLKAQFGINSQKLEQLAGLNP